MLEVSTRIHCLTACVLMPLVVGIILGLALLLLAAVVGVAVRFVRHRKSLMAHARVLEGWGDYAGAAKDLLDAGRWQEAARLLIKAGQEAQSVELYLKHRRPADALNALAEASAPQVEQAEKSFAGRKLLDDPKTRRDLAEIAQRAGAYEMASRFYEQLGDQEEVRATRNQAARHLVASGRLIDAAKIYDKLGEPLRAAEVRVEAARKTKDERVRRALARLAAESFEAQGKAERAVEAHLIAGAQDEAVALLLKSGQVARAAQLLERDGQWLRAAGLYEKQGDAVNAARACRKGGQLHKAAQLLDSAGHHAEAARCLVEVREFLAAGRTLLKGGDVEGALQVFARLDDRDLGKAADLLVASGQLKRAAQLLVRRNLVREAADLLKANGQSDWASELLAQRGDRAEKAKLLLSRGQHEEAANILIELGRTEDAYAALKGASGLKSSGRLLLAKLALQAEEAEVAIGQYSALLEAGASDIDRGEVLYGLSRAYEAAGKVFEASAALQELLSIDPKHRDAALRLRLLQGRFTPQPFALAVSTPPPKPLEVPERAGESSSGLPSRYRIVHEIARGAMGVVYRAIDEQLSRPVAIKLLEPNAGNNARIREYFLREARSVAQLNHPNIVTVYDAGLQESAPWLVMELVEGDDLRTRFGKAAPTLMQSIRIGSQVASALDCAHARGIVHRDLKPENIMVANDGTAKLTDFGIAYVMRSGDDGSKRKNTVVGTPVYMAPEQIKGESIDGRTDIYALGVVLFECFCGRLPFEPETAMFHHTNTPAPDPRLYRPDLPDELAALVLSCLEKSPDMRPQNGACIQRTLVMVGSQLVNLQRAEGGH